MKKRGLQSPIPSMLFFYESTLLQEIVMTVAEYLARVGVEQYTSMFEENDVDDDIFDKCE